MENDGKINVLVLPELFPEHEKDVSGVFIVDYLKSMVSWANPKTLYIRRYGKQKGRKDELFQGKYKLTRITLSTNRKNPFKAVLYLKWFLKGLRASKEFRHIDLIHAHGAILNGTLAWLISRKRGVPFVITEHTGPFSFISGSWWRRKWTKFIMEKAHVVFAVSNHLKNEILESGIKPGKIVVTGNPVDTELFQKGEIGLRSKQFLFVSRLDEFKGGLRTVKAFHSVMGQLSGWNLVIGGDGEEKEKIERYIDVNGLRERVSLTGWLTKKEYAELLMKSSVFVFPSRHESFGLVAAEALSAGVPVIATNKTAPKEYIEDSNGLLVHPDDIEDIADKMVEIGKRLSTYNSEQIRDKIIGKFGLDIFSERLFRCCKSVL